MLKRSPNTASRDVMVKTIVRLPTQRHATTVRSPTSRCSSARTKNEGAEPGLFRSIKPRLSTPSRLIMTAILLPSDDNRGDRINGRLPKTAVSTRPDPVTMIGLFSPSVLAPALFARTGLAETSTADEANSTNFLKFVIESSPVFYAFSYSRDGARGKNSAASRS